MKICHVITRLILGGAQENTVLTCEGLRARGHDVTLVTGPPIGPEGELMTRALKGGYRVIVVDSLRREISLLRDRRAYAELLAVLRDLRPDVMHSHSSKAGILGRSAARRAGGMKVVHTIHGLPFHPHQPWWVSRSYEMLERRWARHTDALVSVADAMTRSALAAGVGRPEQFTTIYSGMEIEPYLTPPPRARLFRESLKLPPDALLVTQVSRLAELKGHEYIIEAADRWRDSRIHFLFVGDGRLRAQLEEDIRRRGLSARFHLAGLLPPEQIPAVMHASDIVVHCSLREGLARAIPQAMLAGRPVVSFDVDGACEVVDSSTGVLAPPGDLNALLAALQSLAASPELRESLGRSGRERCRRMFDHGLMVDRLEDLYRRLTASP